MSQSWQKAICFIYLSTDLEKKKQYYIIEIIVIKMNFGKEYIILSKILAQS